MKVRKKPVIVEAYKYEKNKGLEDGWACIKDLHKDNSCLLFIPCVQCLYHKPYINTLEGKLYIDENDYIIVGIKGERYPIKPDIFFETYEIVEE